MEYLPVRYNGTAQQISDRKSIWNFKDGYCSESIFNDLAHKVSDIAGFSTNNYVVCFVPASTSEKTVRRYSKIASRIQSKTGVKASINAVYKPVDGEAGHISGKAADPASEFSFRSDFIRGKNVILIDDVVTRGRTMVGTAQRLLDNGASSVTGLAVAKTVNPDWAA